MKNILLEDVLRNFEMLEDNKSVGFTKYCPLSLKTAGTLLSDEELEGFAQKYPDAIIIGIYQIQDILENLKLQKKQFNLEVVANAISFYLENDAFIELDS